MAWTKEARAAAALTRRKKLARGEFRSGAKGFRDKVVLAKFMSKGAGNTVSSFLAAASRIGTKVGSSKGATRTQGKVTMMYALNKVSPDNKRLMGMGGSMPMIQQLKYKLAARKQKGQYEAANQIWSAMKRGK